MRGFLLNTANFLLWTNVAFAHGTTNVIGRRLHKEALQSSRGAEWHLEHLSEDTDGLNLISSVPDRAFTLTTVPLSLQNRGLPPVPHSCHDSSNGYVNRPAT